MGFPGHGLARRRSRRHGVCTEPDRHVLTMPSLCRAGVFAESDFAFSGPCWFPPISANLMAPRNIRIGAVGKRYATRPDLCRRSTGGCQLPVLSVRLLVRSGFMNNGGESRERSRRFGYAVQVPGHPDIERHFLVTGLSGNWRISPYTCQHRAFCSHVTNRALQRRLIGTNFPECGTSEAWCATLHRSPEKPC